MSPLRLRSLLVAVFLSGVCALPSARAGAVPARGVAFVDGAVAGHEALVAGVRPGVETVRLDPAGDALAQMATWAETHSGYEAIHVVSHAAPGALRLGGASLDGAALRDPAVAGRLARLGRALNRGGDLLLYGCSLAAGPEGDAYLAAMAKATGADVAGSTGPTGAARLGGDWTLEIATGSIEARPLVLGDFQGVLSTITFLETDVDVFGTHSTITRTETVSSQSITFTAASGQSLTSFYDPEGSIGLNPLRSDGTGTYLKISAPAGYTFDLTSFASTVSDGSLSITLTYGDGHQTSFSHYGSGATLSTQSGFSPSIDNVAAVEISSSGADMFNDFAITDVKAPPSFTGSYTGQLLDTEVTNSFSNVTGTLTATPSTTTKSPIASYGISGGTSGAYAVGGSNYDITKVGTYGTLYLNSSTGAYVYVPNGAAIEALSTEKVGGFANRVTKVDSFPVTATDSAGETAENAVSINLTGQNDTPEITSGATATVAENSTGTVYTVTASDRDSGQTLTYSIAGDDAGLFDINASTGKVSFKAAPDYESPSDKNGNNVYDITVTATDNAPIVPAAPVPNDSAPQPVSITVTDANEAPVITSGSTASVTENSTGTVYTATATDPDSAATLTWSLSGPDAGLFAIDSSTGAVSFYAAPDYESPADNGGNNVYDFTVVVTDNGALTDSQAVTVSVTDANDAPTITSGTTGTVAENAPIDTAIYTATAMDPDAGATLAYSLTGPDAALLNINGSTGAVTLKTPADFETKSSYSFNVVVTDNGTLTATRAVTVSVTDVDEAPTITAATYNAATGVLTVTGTYIEANASGADIDARKFAITGEGGATYTLADTSDVERASATQFTLTLSAADRAAVSPILNKNGQTSTGGTAFNLAAGDDWCTNATAGDTSDATNAVTVSYVPVPTITSAAYNSVTGELLVTGANLVRLAGAANDIDVSRLSVTGEGGPYALSASLADVEITSATSFTVTLTGPDKTQIDARLDQAGTQSSGGTTYNLAAAEDWARGADAAVVTADMAGNGITVILNTSPTVANAIPDQGATENAAFNFQFAANTFVDADAGDTLTYSAQLSGGGPLPAWLSFDPLTRTFSGTPANGDVGTVSIDVVADDGSGGTVTDTFGLVVANASRPPAVATIARTQPGPVTLANTLVWRVTFTEAVTGVDAADFALTAVDGAATATLGTVTAGANAAEYLVTATGLTGAGTLRLDVKATGTGLEDGDGDALAGGFIHGQAYTHAPGTVPVAWGYNGYGQLGFGPADYAAHPVAALVPRTGALVGKTVVALAIGYNHTLALCSDGTVAAWGWNDSGQLGNAETTNSSTPVAVLADKSSALFGKTVVAVSAGELYSLALCSDGTIAAWGYNGQGQLGNGATTNASTPVAVRTDGLSALSGKTVVAVSAGGLHSLALCSDGSVVAWGGDGQGQLGNGTTTEGATSTPVEVLTDGSSALSGKTVVAVSAGAYHSLALCSDGTVAAWGHNSVGELGNGETTNAPTPAAVRTDTGALAGKTVVAVSAGAYHSLALCSDGTVAACGDNSAGQLGNGETTNASTPVAVKTDTGALAGKTVVAVSAGGLHSLALCSEGTVAAWGYNYNGQLGNGETTNASTPVAVKTDTDALSGRTVYALSSGGSAHHSLALASPAKGITAVVPPTAGTYKVGATLTFALTTGEAVTVTGTPRLALTIGAETRHATYASGSGTTNLGFTYTVQAGDTDADGISVASTSVDLNSGTVTDAGGWPITLALPAYTLPTIKVETTAPTLTSVTLVSSNATPTLAKAGDTVTLTFKANETLQTPTVTLAGESAMASYDSGANTWTATRTVAAGDAEGAVTFAIGFSDVAGNAGTAVAATTDSSTVTIDLTAPETTITAQPANPSGSASATFTFGSTDATASFEASLDGAAYAAATSPVSFTGLADGPHTFAVRAIDAAGNVDATPASYTWTVATVFTAPVPDGFGASATGGAAGPNVLATTAAEFATHAASADAQVITVVGTLDIGTVAVASNKTIQGADASATLDGCLSLTNVSNIVIRGLNLANPDGTALRLSGARRVYVTRCSFLDSAAPQLVATGSDQLTVSWCEFAAVVAGQSAVQLGAAGETTTPRITLHHNWWSANLASALPAAASGQVHQYSNYVDVSGNTSGTAVSGSAQLLSEANVYVGTANPLAKSGSALLRALDNTYTTCTGTTDSGADTVFTPSYSYTLRDRDALAALLRAQAGNVMGASYSEESAASASITATATTVVPGASATLTAGLTGATATTYQWRLNNAPISGATGATYTISSMAAAHAGTYTVAVSVAHSDTVVSTPTMLTLGTAPTPPPAPTPTPAKGGGGACGASFVFALGLLAALRRRVLAAA